MMNNISKRISFILFTASAAISAAAVLFRIILTSTVLDVHGLYKRGSIAPTVFHSLLAISVVLLIALVFIKTAKRVDGYTHKPTPFSQATSAAVTVLFIADIVASIYNILKSSESPTTFDILEIAFAIPAAAYFAAVAVKPRRSSVAVALTSLFSTAWCAVCLIRIYFDQELLMTAPGRILDQMALLCAMICFLTETRSHLSKFSHRFFLAACSVAPILLTASSVPNLLFPVLSAEGTSNSFIRNALCLAFALFFFARLGSYTFTNKSVSDREE